MTREDLIKLAREAGFPCIGGQPIIACGEEKLERFATLVAAVERIGCCAAIDEIDDGEAPEYRACQEAIRARGQS